MVYWHKDILNYIILVELFVLYRYIKYQIKDVSTIVLLLSMLFMPILLPFLLVFCIMGYVSFIVIYNYEKDWRIK